ncbi:transmembrane protein 165 [Sitodiplosis mosellana]|uniref:transmembrane protein 165 n=1 Tax=Sitodiplosis mosellana TaxID=263140 RepID=UPI0024440550|nr:transmembrane protein 165 [Sitodiplosis mosellana]XP_055318270.1 transmembrane protein 165 [Sitodiplosis mosellana]XP_055318271.1 transmembrane protein 165 [Sitodiplosis mosellana]XP_055318272.1 transmembrane protein 165 [Sitodiplosis mosellana]
MSPQLINKVLNQNWFVSTQMKEMRRSATVLETTSALQVFHCIENAAAKFIRTMNHRHHRMMLCVIVYCLVLSLNSIKYVNCDIEPHPVNNQFGDDDDAIGVGAAVPRIPVPAKPIETQNVNDAIDSPDNINKSNNYDNILGDSKFLHAFIGSLSVIVVSELGDKTFFIAAIMAMRHPRMIVFVGAITALALMTILSAVFGQLATLIPRVYTYYISTALFAIFGLKMLRDGWYMSPNDAQEEFEEVQSDLKKREDEFEKETATSTILLPDIESGVVTVTENPQVDVNTTDTPTPTRKAKSKSNKSIMTRVLIQAFSMTFLAEWGDRSQFTTIILAARDNLYGVIVGGVLGHSFCTGLAVIGGRMIAQRISVRTVTIVGGIVFICFAFSAFFFNSKADENPSIKP